MILFTTSRKPSKRMRAFARDLSSSVPYAKFYSRGKANIERLVRIARNKALDFIVIVLGSNGNPSMFRIIKLENESWNYIYQIKIKLYKLRKEFVKKKFLVRELKLEIKNKEIKSLFRKLNISSQEDAEFVLKENKKIMSFFYRKREIGPRFEIYEIQKF